MHRAQVPHPAGVGEKTCARCVWGWGEEGWKPAGERAEEAVTLVPGAAWWNGARGASSRKKAAP